MKHKLYACRYPQYIKIHQTCIMVVVVQNPSLCAHANVCHLIRVSKTNASITIKNNLYALSQICPREKANEYQLCLVCGDRG
jgi:hypothetical protein